MNSKGIVLIAALSAAASAADAASFSKQIPVGAGDPVRITNVAGSVTITTWDRHEVDIQGELESGIDRVDVRQDKTGIDIEVVMKEMPWVSSFDGRNGNARLQIRLPSDVRLEASTVSASLDVTGVRGKSRLKSVSGNIRSDVLGDEMDAKTVSGRIQLNGSGSHGRVRASSVSGEVVMNRVGGEIEARTTSGDVDVAMEDASDVRAGGVSGDVSLHGGLSKTANVEAETVSGRVKISAKAAGGFRYDVSTFSGRVTNCGSDKGSGGPDWGRKHVEGTSGEGSAGVRVKSHSGSVEICDR